MEVVLTSNLVSSENEKKTTAYNFQTMAMNSFVTCTTPFDERPNGNLWIFANMKLFVVS